MVPFEYTVPEASDLAEFVGRPDLYQFNAAGDSDGPAVAVRLVTRVFTDPCDMTAGHEPLANARNLADHLTGIPELQATDVGTSVVDSRPALTLTVTPKVHAGCDAIALWPGSQPLSQAVDPGTSLRYTIVEVGANPVISGPARTAAVDALVVEAAE